MTRPTKKKSTDLGPLIIETDARLISRIQGSALAKKLPPRIVDSHEDLGSALEEYESAPLSGVFIGTELSDMDPAQVLEAVRARIPGALIFLLQGERSFDAHEGFVIQGVLKKPVDYADMLDVLEYPIEHVPVEKPRRKGEISAKDDQFAGMPISQFFPEAESPFEIFLRLAPNRFVKIVHLGGELSREQISRYAEKGVDQFYVQRGSLEHFLAYRDNVAAVTIRSPLPKGETKAIELMRHGERVMTFLKLGGLSEKKLEAGIRFLKNLQALVIQIGAQRNAAIAKLLNDVGSCEHGAGTAIITGVVLEEIQGGLSHFTEAVGLASLLHDVGLYQLPPELHHENEALMTDPQRKLFRTHMAKGAEILGQIKGIAPEVIDTVLHHHDRAMSGAKVDRMTEIVAAADEFVRLIAASKPHLGLDPFQKLSQSILKEFSPEVAGIFHKAFPPKRSTP